MNVILFRFRQLGMILFAGALFAACSFPAAQPSSKRPPRPAPPGAATSVSPQATAAPAPGVLLFTIGVHVEPMGMTAQGYTSGSGNYNNPGYLRRHMDDLDRLAKIVEAHGGVLVVQAQSPFTTALIAQHDDFLARLAQRGHEIGLHFHEDAHLGANPEALPPEKWCEVMKEEIGYIQQASGVEHVRYWSGGNLYPSLYKAAVCAGLSVNSDWKNPATQHADPLLVGVNPWRPAGGTDGTDFSRFATHDPNGAVIFLPDGLYDQNAFVARRGQNSQAYFDYLATQLQASVEAARADRVNVFHFTVHPGEFRGGPNDEPFKVIDDFLTNFVDPLVASGRVQWATFSQMADAFAEWEQAHPNEPPR